MTTNLELGQMLIEVGRNGRMLQAASPMDEVLYWTNFTHGPLYPNSKSWVYRLKPLKKTVYVNLPLGYTLYKTEEDAQVAVDHTGITGYIGIAIPVPVGIEE